MMTAKTLGLIKSRSKKEKDANLAVKTSIRKKDPKRNLDLSKYGSDEDEEESEEFKNLYEKKLNRMGRTFLLKKQLAPIKFVARVMSSLVILGTLGIFGS